jgi:hypothetical protein
MPQCMRCKRAMEFERKGLLDQCGYSTIPANVYTCSMCEVRTWVPASWEEGCPLGTDQSCTKK